jgi:hypothetical protein
MVRLRAEAVIGSTGLQEEIAHRQAMHQKKLNLYRRLEQRDFHDKLASRARRLQHLVLKAGMGYEELWLDSTREALEILALPASGGDD